MKRLLSILLVTMLVIGLVPAMASAAEVQVVDFTGHTGKTPLDIEYDTAGWEANINGTGQYLLGDKWNTKTYLSDTSGLYVYFDNAAKDGERAAIDFKVNESGYYDICVNVSNVVSTKVNDIPTPYDGYFCVWIDGRYAGEINLVKGKGANTLRPMYLEEGRHTFFVCQDRTGNFDRYARCVISDITLTPITAEKAALKDVYVSLESASIGMGDMVEAYATLIFENGARMDLYPDSLLAKEFSAFQTSEEKLEVTVGDEKFAVASGNVVTGKDVGTTDVIFTATLGENGTKAKSTKLVVNPKFTLRYKDETSWKTSAATGYYLSHATAGNNWIVETDKKYTGEQHIDGSTKAARLQSSVAYMYLNTYGPITVNLDAPYAGLYDVVMEHTAYSGNGIGDIYVNDEYIGTFNDNIDRKDITAIDRTPLLSTELKKGENKITIYPSKARIFPVAIEFASIESADTLTINAAISTSEIEKDATAQISVTASASDGTLYYVKDSIFGGSTLATTYKSNNVKVATVSDSGVVTAVGPGEAEITVSATYPGCKTPFEKKFAIIVPDRAPGIVVEDTAVSVGVSAEKGGSVTTSLGNIVGEVEIGTRVYVTAVADEGYEFAYWGDSNKKVLSTKAEDSFVINVNTGITAYFEKLPEADATVVPVYFYNGNGEILEKVDVEKGKTFGEMEKPEAKLTGFAFDKWSVANNAIITGITRAVAMFRDSDKTYTVKVGDEIVASGKKYGEEVTVSATEENFTCWKLGDNVVSYDAEFTLYVYNDVTLTKVCEGAAEKVPTVVLDTVNGENFLIYNVPTGYTKIEAGILFAESGTPDIGSFHAKATEKTSSGQFTAKPNDDEKNIARGYMIFKNPEGQIRVIYSN